MAGIEFLEWWDNRSEFQFFPPWPFLFYFLNINFCTFDVKSPRDVKLEE